jgi:hypothetical protein
MRKLLTFIIWMLFGAAMFALGFYIGTRGQRSAAIIHISREHMDLITLTEQQRYPELSQRLSSSLNAYRTQLDEFANGRGLNPESREAVRAARADIDRFRDQHPQFFAPSGTTESDARAR